MFFVGRDRRQTKSVVGIFDKKTNRKTRRKKYFGFCFFRLAVVWGETTSELVIVLLVRMCFFLPPPFTPLVPFLLTCLSFEMKRRKQKKKKKLNKKLSPITTGMQRGRL